MNRSPGWALLRTQLATTRTALVRVLVWSAAEALPSLLSGLLIAAATDRGFLAGRPAVGFAWLAAFAAAVGVRAYAARAAFPYVAAVVEPLRDALVRRVVRSALGRAEPTGDGPAEVARLTEQVESARQLTATLLRTLRSVGITVLAAVLGLAVLAPVTLPLVLPPLLVGGLLFARLLGPLVARQRAVVLADERVAAEAGLAFAGVRDITACGAQARVERAVGAAVLAQGAAVRALGRAAALRTLTVAVGGRLPLLLVVAAAPWLLGHRYLTTGQLLGVAAYLVQQLEPAVRSLAGMVGSWLLELAVVLDRLATLPRPIGRPAVGQEPAEDAVVRVRGLHHAHGAAAEPVFSALDLTLAPGEHLAVVGPSGAGKSTLAALLAGLLPPQQGAVTVGGAAPHTLPDRARAGLVALLPQEAYLFAGTVGENLRWLRPDATDRQLTEAAELLGAAELLERLGGPAAELPDPATLSAGERQLLALVRTYLSPAPVVVLDEATCHLDAQAEAVAEAAFAARPGTLVVIAHRIGSALRADRVLLLDAGRGLTARHGDLQVLSPLYRELVGHWLGSALPQPDGLAIVPGP
ncbi:ATP-binding cassette subfamily C protein [Kitasatospora gansuensis]|uniref:ATP-binding cassette subfamily C protein n=1 Tax=Kitasatospora gansuensis TaxID=258050 RepID=A0A7W7SG01_9ACTN|nr:ABC transporter ATP-binding protein [Kitasatospora gansuensis]MBB4949774.1 ATP-binding cassette subfamily C protein [Kitasatospora gansuensis]